MKKTASKWPSRAINLLVALSMVISLVLVLAPAVAAQAAPPCDPVERFSGCNLEVFVNTYVKDIDGDFTPVSQIEAGTPSDPSCFYVNAVVVNTGNVTADDISATISLGAGMALASCDAGNATKVWDADINWRALDPAVPGRVAEFWWQVCCSAPSGYQTISVLAVAELIGGQPGRCEATGTTSMTQITPEVEECLYIEIIEAPGWAAPGYTMTFPNALVTPCTNFGIKALVRNDCSGTLNNVDAIIQITGPASIVEDTNTWHLGNLYPGEERIVAWTLHCDGPGDVVIEVHSNETSWADDYGPHNPYPVEQFGAGDLVVDITSPLTCFDVCAGCAPANEFPVIVVVTNNTGETVTNIVVQLQGNNSSAFTVVGASFKTIASLTHGGDGTVTFTGRCTAPGEIRLTANAEGQGATQTYTAVPDSEDIHQKYVMARITDYDSHANICKTFEIIGAYKNCSGQQLINVLMSITWRGNATLILTGVDKPVYDKQTGLGWENFSSLNTTIEDLGGGWYRNTQIAIICSCCETLVRWRFNCTGNTDVEAYATVEWTGLYPAVPPPTPAITTFIDDSATVTITQQWKAHLIVGLVPFLQDEGGCMWNRNAFAPCQNFHVVIPVVNVGDASAENVQVTFKILSDPTRWDFVSISGDVSTQSWTESTATGVATIPSIPGNSVKKVIVQLHCTGEGLVQFNIQSVVGTDGGTLLPIEADNIERPPCPLDIYQIPFTVTILNPFTCDTFNPGDVFGVKAVIENGSALDLAGVTATIHWTTVPPNGVALAAAAPAQKMTKTLGNATAGSSHEITWELVCMGAGEVDLWVTAATTSPYYITAESDSVNVHQRDCIDVSIDILSPDPIPSYEDDWDETAIATSEEFAVTALVMVNGTPGQQAEGVQACIYVNPTMLEVLDESTCKQLGTMDVGTQTIVTWTLHALATSHQECSVNSTTITTVVSTSSRACIPENDSNSVDVTIYPAAHLMTEIVSITPASPFVVCEEFEVTYRIWNTGEADAWEVSATLSVNPADSVRIAEGEGGYTHFLGAITGWSYYSEGYYYIEDSFILHCKQICESTITITPDGNDECGWHTVFVQDANHYDAEYEWFNMPGREIDAEFIQSASQTVKQVESDQITGDMTEYDINLLSGWNLISLPLIPNSTAIATVLADVDENVDIVWAYDAATLTWTSWVPGLGGDLSTMSDGKGYWIDMDAADLLTINGVELKPAPYTPPSYAVVAGWNLIGFKCSVQRTAGDYLAGIVGKWTRIYTYSADTDMYSAVGSDAMMNPGKGYWIAVTTAGTIYP